MADTVRLIGPSQRAHAHRLIDAAPSGYVLKLAPETRRDRQNARMWAMIADLQRQVPELRDYSADDIKTRFLHALGAEMRFLPELEGSGVFPVGLRSSTLTVAQFGGLIELIGMYGAKRGVVFSEPEENGDATFGNYRRQGLGDRPQRQRASSD